MVSSYTLHMYTTDVHLCKLLETPVLSSMLWSGIGLVLCSLQPLECFAEGERVAGTVGPGFASSDLLFFSLIKISFISHILVTFLFL